MDLNGNGHTQPPRFIVPNPKLKQSLQAAKLQRFAFDAAMSLRDGCTDSQTGKVAMDVKTAVAVQKLIGAWDTAADRLRVLKGKGLPASVKAKARTTSQPEPLEPA